MTNETNSNKPKVVARIDDDNMKEYDVLDVPNDSPDPNIPETDNPDIHIYWLDGDNRSLLTTEQTNSIEDGTFFCSPALAIRPNSLADPEQARNMWMEINKMVLDGGVSISVENFHRVPHSQFFAEVSEKINFYRRENLSREADLSWTIPPDCPIGDEAILECLLPWPAEVLLTNPNLMLSSDPWPRARLHPYMLMPLAIESTWANRLGIRARTYYAEQLGIDVETVFLERGKGLDLYVRRGTPDSQVGGEQRSVDGDDHPSVV